MNTKTHWEHIYKTKVQTQVSWYQEHAHYSLQCIQKTGLQKTDRIVDIGGGASTLVDDLIADGYQRISILDVSGTALQLARQRLGVRAGAVVRYSPESLHDEFGVDFELVDSARETHETPFGTEQRFIYCYCRRQ